MDDSFGWVGALFQVFVTFSQQCQHSNLESKVPRSLWDTGAASMSQLEGSCGTGEVSPRV